MPDPSSASSRPRTQGTFFDGHSARPRPVSVTLSSAGIEILGEGSRDFGSWSYGGLSGQPELATEGEAELTHREHPDARLVITDPAVLARLRTLAPRALARPSPGGGKLHILGMIALIVAIIAGGVLFVVPRSAGLVAGLIPIAWESGWGQSVARQLTVNHKVCRQEDGTRALQQMTARLLGTRSARGSGYTITFTVIETKAQNAFATLGGRIIIFSGLIEKMEGPDELAGVLAHEIGHVTARHPLTGTIEAAFTMMLARLFGGGGSDVGGGLANIGGVLAISSYSRTKEAQADDFALAILDQAGISADGLADFFRRLQSTGKGGPSGALALFSTHPALGARAAQIREQGRARAATRPALSPADWRALKRICG